MFEEALDNYWRKHTVYLGHLFDISHIVAYNSYDDMRRFFCITIALKKQKQKKLTRFETNS